MEIAGKSVFSGIAIGKISVFNSGANTVKKVHIKDPEREVACLEAAVDRAKEQLSALYEKAVKEVGEVDASIFEVHQMMLEDHDYIESIKNIIRTQKLNAEFAVATTGDHFSEMFAAMDDDYMRSRADDVKDISNRVILILQKREENKCQLFLHLQVLQKLLV